MSFGVALAGGRIDGVKTPETATARTDLAPLDLVAAKAATRLAAPAFQYH